jgi:hypothetical protein
LSFLNGSPFYTATKTGAVYIPLPQQAWVSVGACSCSRCKGAEGFWDTMVVPGSNDRQAWTWTCHMPELQKGEAPAWLVRGHREGKAAR